MARRGDRRLRRGCRYAARSAGARRNGTRRDRDVHCRARFRRRRCATGAPGASRRNRGRRRGHCRQPVAALVRVRGGVRGRPVRRPTPGRLPVGGRRAGGRTRRHVQRRGRLGAGRHGRDSRDLRRRFRRDGYPRGRHRAARRAQAGESAIRSATADPDAGRGRRAGVRPLREDRAPIRDGILARGRHLAPHGVPLR